jgi:hypothetical protein
MDLKESNPPVNPLVLPAYQKGADKLYASKHTKDYSKGGKPTNSTKTKNWKYMDPKKASQKPNGLPPLTAKRRSASGAIMHSVIAGS